MTHGELDSSTVLIFETNILRVSPVKLSRHCGRACFTGCGRSAKTLFYAQPWPYTLLRYNIFFCFWYWTLYLPDIPHFYYLMILWSIIKALFGNKNSSTKYLNHVLCHPWWPIVRWSLKNVSKKSEIWFVIWVAVSLKLKWKYVLPVGHIQNFHCIKVFFR